MDIISITDLHKYYGTVHALKGVHLTISPGEVFGFLGPNGAGKTTTIRCMLDIIHRDSGEVKLFGIDPQVNPVAVRAQVGYLPGELHFESNFTGLKLLKYLNRLRGGKTDWAYVKYLSKFLNISLDTPIRNLSHGNKQKIGIIQAFMHHPSLLLLDEPTTGLDLAGQQKVLELIRTVQSEGTTIFLSSHIMREVEVVAERVGIIRDGVIVEVAKVNSLLDRSIKRMRIKFLNKIETIDFDRFEGVKVISKNRDKEIFLQIQGSMDALIKKLAEYPVQSIETERPTLEEVFFSYYQAE
jgi:ABC-2 type transport system ATP-binding protein